MPSTDDNQQPPQLGFDSPLEAFQRLAEMVTNRMARAENGVDFIKQCCKLLSAYGVQQIICEYDGSGDSGDFFSTLAVITPAREQLDKCLSESSAVSQDTIANVTRPKTIQWDEFVAQRSKDKKSLITAEMCQTLIDNAFDLLPGGWEINDGSYGTITVDVASERIDIEHNERYTDVRTENMSF